MFLGQTSDLDNRWQAVILTDSFPLCLKDMIAMRLGFQCMRREKAVVLAREAESIDHALTVNSAKSVAAVQFIHDEEQVLPSVDQKIEWA